MTLTCNRLKRTFHDIEELRFTCEGLKPGFRPTQLGGSRKFEDYIRRSAAASKASPHTERLKKAKIANSMRTIIIPVHATIREASDWHFTAKSCHLTALCQRHATNTFKCSNRNTSQAHHPVQVAATLQKLLRTSPRLPLVVCWHHQLPARI